MELLNIDNYIIYKNNIDSLHWSILFGFYCSNKISECLDKKYNINIDNNGNMLLINNDEDCILIRNECSETYNFFKNLKEIINMYKNTTELLINDSLKTYSNIIFNIKTILSKKQDTYINIYVHNDYLHKNTMKYNLLFDSFIYTYKYINNDSINTTINQIYLEDNLINNYDIANTNTSTNTNTNTNTNINICINKLMKKNLYNYQIENIKWFNTIENTDDDIPYINYRLYHQINNELFINIYDKKLYTKKQILTNNLEYIKIKNGFLCDDVGKGKTSSFIGYIMYDFYKNNMHDLNHINTNNTKNIEDINPIKIKLKFNKPNTISATNTISTTNKCNNIIICPRRLADHWKSEFNNFVNVPYKLVILTTINDYKKYILND